MSRTQTLLKNIQAITEGPDELSARLAEIRLYLHTHKEKKQDSIKVVSQLLPSLKQPFAYFDAAARESLIKNYQTKHPALLQIQQASKKIVQVIEQHKQSFPENVTQTLNAIITIYKSYLNKLKSAQSNARQQLLAHKAQLSGPELGFYYVSVETAHTLMCQDTYGDSIKTNKNGCNPVARLGQVFFKPAHKLDEIQPANEQAISSFGQLFTAQHLFVTSTLLKVSDVPQWDIPTFNLNKQQDKASYVKFDELKFHAGYKTNIILEQQPDLKKKLLINSQRSSLLIQASHAIEGVNLIDVVYLRIFLKQLPNKLEPMTADKIVQGFLSGSDNESYRQRVYAHEKCLALKAWQDKEPDIEDYPSQQHFQFRDLLYQAYAALFEKADDEHLLPKEKNEKKRRKNEFINSYEHLGPHAYLETLGLFLCYPALANVKSFTLWAQFPRLVRETYSKLISTAAQKNSTLAYSEIDRLFYTLDPDAISELWLGLLLSQPTDAKLDNFIFRFKKNEQGEIIKSDICSIDNDKGFVHPVVKRSSGAYEVKVINIFYLFSDIIMNKTISVRLIKTLQNQSAEQWLLSWLAQQLRQARLNARWQIQADINAADLENHTKVTIQLPFQMSRSVLSFIYQRLKQLQDYLFEMKDPLPTHQKVLEALYPIVAICYQHVREKTGKDFLAAQRMLYEQDGFLRKFSKKLDRSIKIQGTPLKEFLAQANIPELRTISKGEDVCDITALLTHFIQQTIPWDKLSQSLQFSLLKVIAQMDVMFRLPLKLTRIQILFLESVKQGALQVVNLLLHNGAQVEPAREYSAQGTSTDKQVTLPMIVFYQALNKAVYRQQPRLALAMLHLLLDAGLASNGYIHTGEPYLIAWMAQAEDTQALMLKPLLSCLQKAGADLDLVDKSSHSFVLDSLITQDKPRLFVLLVALGAIRVTPDKAWRFMQRHKKISGMDSAIATLCRENLDVHWQSVRQHLWMRRKPKPDVFEQKVMVFKSGGTSKSTSYIAYLNPVLTMALIDVKTGQFKPRTPKTKRQQQVTDSSTSKLRVSNDESRGRHPVKIAILNKVSLHCKEKPDMPGVEFAVHSLAGHVLGPGYIVPGESLNFMRNDGQRYPVFFSPTQKIGGIEVKTLTDVLKNKSLSQRILLQPCTQQLSGLLCFSMLINPGDGKPENYVVATSPNNPEQYHIRSIDNDHAFAKPMTGSTLNVLCALFCLEAMHEVVHPQVRVKLLALDAKALLRRWLEDVGDYQAQVESTYRSKDSKNLFSQDWKQRLLSTVRGDAEPLSSFLGMPFPPKSISRLYTKITHLQRFLREQPLCTHLELLGEVEPVVGLFYAEVLQRPLSAYQRILKIGRLSKHVKLTTQGEYTLTSSRGGLEIMGVPKQDISLLAQGVITYSINEALAELDVIAQQLTQMQQISEALIRGQSKSFKDLILDEHQANVIKQIDFAALRLKSGRLDIQKQKRILQAIIEAKVNFRRLYLPHCAALDDAMLARILESCTYLVRINLAGCTQLSNNALLMIKAKGRYLQSLNVSHLPRVTQFALNFFQALSFPTLTRLSLSHCQKLSRLDIQAPKLSYLDVSHNPSLKTFKHNSQRQLSLNLLGSATESGAIKKLLDEAGKDSEELWNEVSQKDNAYGVKAALKDLSGYATLAAGILKKDGQTLLHLAAKHQDWACMQSLLTLLGDRAKDEIVREDYLGQTVLHLAAKHQDWACMQSLLTLLGDRAKDEIVREDYLGQTVLHLVAGHQDGDCMQSLLTLSGGKAKDAIVKANSNDSTVLHLAARYQDGACVQSLLTLLGDRAKDKIIREDYLGSTMLHYAAVYQDEACVQSLLTLLGDRAKAEIVKANKYGETVLHYAAVYQDGACLQSLLTLFGDRAKAEIVKANKYGRTVLHLAVIYQDGACMQSLLTLLGGRAKDAIVKANKYGQTVLHLAAKNNKMLSAAYLLRAGASLEQKNLQGNTALIIAKQRQHKELFNYLLRWTKQPELLEQDIVGLEHAEKNKGAKKHSSSSYTKPLDFISDKKEIIINSVQLEKSKHSQDSPTTKPKFFTDNLSMIGANFQNKSMTPSTSASSPITIGDGNCLFNAVAQGLFKRLSEELDAKHIQSNQASRNLSQPFIGMIKQFGANSSHWKTVLASSNSRQALKAKLDVLKYNVVAQQRELAPLLRKVAIDTLKQNYANFAATFRGRLEALYDNPHIEDIDHFGEHVFISKKMQTFKKIGSPNSKAQFLRWWEEEGKQFYFKTMATAATDASDKARWGGEVELTALGIYFQLNIQWQKHGAKNVVGVLGGVMPSGILSATEGQLLQDWGIAEPWGQTWRLYRDAKQKIENIPALTANEVEQVRKLLKSKTSPTNLKLALQQKLKHRGILRENNEFITQDSQATLATQRIQSYMVAISYLKQKVLKLYQDCPVSFAISYDLNHWFYVKPKIDKNITLQSNTISQNFWEESNKTNTVKNSDMIACPTSSSSYSSNSSAASFQNNFGNG